MTVVAISGLHRGENPQPGASVIASLKRSFKDIRIVGLSYDSLESGIYNHDESRPDASYLLPFPMIGPDALWERLKEILDKEKIDFMIPCLDSEISNMISLEPKLNKLGIKCILPTEKSLKNHSKQNLYKLCKKIDVSAPETKVINNAWELESYANEATYPVYIKGKFYGAELVTWKQDFIRAANDISQLWGWPIITQEAIFGDEYDITGLGDGEGNVIQLCSIRKMLITSKGKAFGGIVVEDPELDELARRIIKELRWNGPFELEFIKKPNGKPTLLEINPRFPAWIDFPSQIGCNLPARLMERFLDVEEPTPLRDCSAGQMFIRHSVDVVGDIKDLADIARNGERVNSPLIKELDIA